MLIKYLLSLSLIASASSFTLSQNNLFSLFPTSTDNKKVSVVAQLSNTELENIAKTITVKVHVGEYRASGILITKEDNTYTVITNAHVTERDSNYSIETSDGVKHTATLVSKDGTDTDNDLAVLQFNSNDNYQVAKVDNSNNLTEGESVTAAGFPYDANNLLISQGKISLLTDKPLQGGYQIGFNNETAQGMSGGVLLNAQGEVIGVLGKGNVAILDTAYVYQDGTTPTGETLEKIQQANFSIPIASVEEIAPQLASIIPGNNATIAPTPDTKEYTGVVKTVDDIAEQITVRIDNIDGLDNGSGVIVAKQGKTYYVATAKHVLCNKEENSSCVPRGQYQVVTSDGVIHKLDTQTIQAPEEWLDVAVFKFESDNNYSVATIGNYNAENKWIFVSGFPGVTPESKDSPSRLLSGGKIQPGSAFGTKDNNSLKENGQYGIVYTNISAGGMSGGAILDSQGRLVGIHTGSESEIFTDDEGDYGEFNLGYSLGVGIQDVLGLIQKSKTNLQLSWLQIETEPAIDISNEEVITVRQQLQTVNQPTQNAEIEAWMNYGNQLWRYEKYDEAVAAFKKVIELDPNFDRAYYAMALAFIEKKDYQQAVTVLEKATVINPSPSYYWRWLGFAYADLKKYDRAVTAYNRAIEGNPENFVLYAERGDVFLNSGDYQQSLESYQQAIKINSYHPWIYNNRANTYANLKQSQKSIADYDRAIEINPLLAIAYNNRGTVYTELEQPKEAIADYTQAIQIDNEYAVAYHNRGFTYANSLQQPEKAIADYTQAVTINNKFAQAYNSRGNTYTDLQQYEKAIADFTKAIESDPKYADAYYNRGIVYDTLEQLDKAIADFSEVIALNPQDASAYYNRAGIYGRLKQYDKAIADYTEAIKINPKDARYYNNRGIAYGSLDKLDLAIADFNKAIEIDDKSADTYSLRGLVYFKLGNIQQAKQDLERAASLHQEQGDLEKYQSVQGILQQL